MFRRDGARRRTGSSRGHGDRTMSPELRSFWESNTNIGTCFIRHTPVECPGSQVTHCCDPGPSGAKDPRDSASSPGLPRGRSRSVHLQAAQPGWLRLPTQPEELPSFTPNSKQRCLHLPGPVQPHVPCPPHLSSLTAHTWSHHPDPPRGLLWLVWTPQSLSLWPDSFRFLLCEAAHPCWKHTELPASPPSSQPTVLTIP